MSRRTRVVLEALVSGVLLAAILHWAGIHRVLHELSRTQLRWFLPAVAVSVATVPLMALRWRLLLSAKGIDAPLAWLTRTYFVALFAGQFLPAAIGGDAVRAVELGRRTHDAPEAVASVLIDRLVGLVSLVALAVAAVAVGGGSARRPGVIAAEAAFGVAAAGTLALLFSSVAVGVGLSMGGKLIKGRGPDLRVAHEALSMATIVAIVVHAVALLGDSFMHPSLADITIPFVSSYMTAWTTIGIVGGWMMIILGLSFYVRGRIGQQRWRKLHRFTALAWILGLAHSLGQGTDAGKLWFLVAAGIVVLPAGALLAIRMSDPRPAPRTVASEAVAR
jgi:sulfoxide reductase heme-binding subunit YedZ